MKLSISGVMFLAILIASLTTALVGFIPTYEAGRDGIDDTVQILRRSVVARVDASLRLFINRPSSILAMVADQGRVGIDSMNATGANSNDPIQTFKFLCSIMASLKGVAPTVASQYFGLPGSMDPDQQGTLLLCDHRFGFPQVGRSDPVTKLLQMKKWNMTTNDYVTGTPNGTTISYYNARERAEYHASLLPPGQFYDPDYRWSGVTAGWDRIRLYAHTIFPDVNGNRSRFMLEIMPSALKAELFDKLSLSSGGRVMLLDALTYRVFGMSWDEEPADKLANWTNFALPDQMRFRFKNASDVSDPLMLKVTSALGGDESYFRLPDTYSATLFEGSDRVFLDVKRFHNEYGVDFRMVVATPEEDFVGDINDQQTITIIVLVVVMVVMLILAVVFSVLLRRPLKQLGHRMYLTASLQDEAEDSSQSILSEIAEMQEAYETMKSELSRMKAYLPQSVLQGADDDDEDESVADESKASTHSEKSRRSDATSRRDETASVRSNSSPSASTASHMATAHAGLNIKRNTLNKRVAVAVFNLMNSHAKITASANGKFVETQSTLLSLVHSAAQDNRGVVDTFNGDHVVVSFGAVKSCACPGRRAAVTALTVANQLPEGLLLSVGIAQGVCLVGNMGTNELQRFNIVGSAYPLALHLERHAASLLRDCHEPGSEQAHRKQVILSSESVMSETYHEFNMQVVDFVQCPGTTTKQRLAVIEKAKSMANDEWMYQLEESAAADPHTIINEAFNALSEGNTEKAANLLRSAVAGAGSRPPLLGVKRLRALLDESNMQ